MRHYGVKKIASGAFAVMLAVSTVQPLLAEELNTEIPSAGAAVIIEDYISNAGTEKDLSSYLPKEAAPTVQVSKTEKTQAEKEDQYFKDIAIAKVSGGEEGYVNVRKKANTDSKIVGKIYNNCGARILETTENGWYKIVSGNCTGYIKAEYFAIGSEAKEHALDDGYVFANIKGTGIHVREKTTTDSDVVTNVYHNENYVIKKFSKDGNWVKLKIGAGVSGWVSADFVKISIDMDTAITIKEEKEMIRKQKEEEEREAREARERQQAEEAQRQTQQNNSGSSNTYSNSNSSNSNSTSSNRQTANRSNSGSGSKSYGDAGGSGASAVVSYAKQFLGNPYVWGGSSLTNGTDCSGFTMSVYAHFGYSLNRSSYTQVYNGRSVSMSALKPGDLLFYKYGGSTISHVAIYIGGGQIIHASTEETGIIISGMGSPCAARRIIG